MIKCKYCKAPNEENSTSCLNCGALMPKRANLSEKEKQNLTNYINSVEQMLKASKGKKDSPIIFCFILFALALISEIIVLNQFTNMSGFMIFIVSFLFGGFLFVVFGFVVIKMEEKAVNNAYHQRIKSEIEEYLIQMHFEKIDFKIVANEVLPKNAFLYKFLDEY